MKKPVLLLAVMAVTLAMSAGCSASKSAVMSEADVVTVSLIDEMIAERLYKVDFTRAYPVSGPSFPLTSPYYVSVIGDRVESFLPYFGRAWNIPYGGGEGLRFEAPVSDYTQTLNRKGIRVITFRAKTDEDSYDFTLRVSPLGESDLTIIPAQRQSISFSGAVDLDPEFEAVRVD